MQLLPPYRVHMRSTPTPERDTWAALVQRTREAAGLTKVELARRLGVDRNTIGRWEAGRNPPDQLDVVQKFADLFAMDLDDVLTVAGFRPAATTPRPEPRDPDVMRLIELFEDPTTKVEVKEAARVAIRAVMDMAEAQPKAIAARRRKAV